MITAIFPNPKLRTRAFVGKTFFFYLFFLIFLLQESFTLLDLYRITYRLMYRSPISWTVPPSFYKFLPPPNSCTSKGDTSAAPARCLFDFRMDCSNFFPFLTSLPPSCPFSSRLHVERWTLSDYWRRRRIALEENLFFPLSLYLTNYTNVLGGWQQAVCVSN